MAEETDLSRTEPASAKRLQAARRAGDVPRSAELSGWLVLLAALGALNWLAPRLFESLRQLMRAAFETANQPTVVGLSASASDALSTALWATLPLLALIFLAVLAAPLALSGWVYAPQAAQADITRANPWRALARLFSPEALFSGGMAALKPALVAGALAWMLADGWTVWQTFAAVPPAEALALAATWLGRGLFVLAGVLALAAALDAGWRWWCYLRRHAMSWQDVLAEARESEPSPELRARLHARRQQVGRGGADVRRGVDEVIG
jgi:flagellar biosynthetic protein FlhB